LDFNEGKRFIYRMLRILISATGLAALLCGLNPFAVAQPTAESVPPATRLAFISDTQTPLWVESIFVGADRNEEATDSLFADILRVHPATLFMLGDLVSLGAHEGAWEKIDRDIRAARTAGIPVHAILGNHELMFYPRTGEQHFAQTFPAHRKTGYCASVDSVAVILLNSNFNELEEAEQKEQERWYAETLDSLEHDSATVCIVVCCHHSPFTNSMVVRSSREVREKFVPSYLRASKCVLFLSGHAHTFEHFREQGKDFLVIGGGGGSRHRVLTGAEQNWKDIAPPQKPLFHYISLERRGTSLHISVRELRRDFRGVEGGYALDVSCAIPTAD